MVKRKKITKTYLRDVSKYEIKLYIDEDELEDALEEKDITEEDYKLVMEVKDKLLNEIKTNTNELMKLDYNKYLF